MNIAENGQEKSVFDHRMIRYPLGLLIAAAVALELVFLFQSIFTLTSSRDVLLASDDDAAVFLDVTTRTTWLNSINAPYGPLYYRVSASVEKLVPSALFKGRAAPTEGVVYRSHHFALMLVSVLSLLLLSALVAYRIRAGLPERLTVFGGLVYMLLHYHVWAKHIFRAHPELFLTALVAVATLFSLRTNKRGARWRNASFYLAALFWGLACAVKTSAGAFALGYCLLLLIPYSKRVRFFHPRRLAETAVAGATMVASYVVSGLPGTLYLGSDISNAARFVSSKSQGFSITWSLGWLADFAWHLVGLAALVFVSAVVFEAAKPRRERSSPPPTEAQPAPVLGDTWAGLLICLVPLLLILKTRLVIPTQHYMLTIIGSFLVFQTFIQRRYASKLRELIQRGVPRVARSTVAPLLIVVVSILILMSKGTSGTAIQIVEQQTACIAPAQRIIDTILQKRRSRRDLVVSTPYFPYPLDQRYRQVWGMTDDRIHHLKPRYLGISERYANRFLGEVSTYDRHNRPDWKKVQAFHRRFRDTDEVVDAHGTHWKLVLRTETCGYELWQRDAPLPR